MLGIKVGFLDGPDIGECLRDGELGNDLSCTLSVLWPVRSNCEFTFMVNGHRDGELYMVVRNLFLNSTTEAMLGGTARDDYTGRFGLEFVEYFTWMPGVGLNSPNVDAESGLRV